MSADRPVGSDHRDPSRLELHVTSDQRVNDCGSSDAELFSVDTDASLAVILTMRRGKAEIPA